MSGRDPDESHRAATPLELLFDLTFVVAFGIAADELSHYLAEGHLRTALLAFPFATFAVSWAWINFSWFASAYDTDDWVFRLLTLVQMFGVLVLSLGISSMFESIDSHEVVNNGVMVAGYVVMRIAMVGHWLRAAHHDPARRPAALTYVTTILIAQTGWVALILVRTDAEPLIGFMLLLLVIEFAGPWIAETRKGGTPWHPHHIAERYGLFVIICLGEAILGTIAALSAIVGPSGPGWSLEAVVVGVSGVTLTFGMWWTYFVVPSGDILAARRGRAFGWSYTHIPVFAAIVATGAGLHVGAYLIDQQTVLSPLESLLTTAVPVAVYVITTFVIYANLTRTVDRFHFSLALGSAVVLAISIAMVQAGVDFKWSLLVLSLTPWVTVVGYEVRGHLHHERVLSGLRG